MLKIYKYPIPTTDYFELELPQGAQILHIDEQYGEPQLWALVKPTAPYIKRKFRFAGTGHPITEKTSELYHRGTFKLRGGALIFHIFEVIK